MVASADWREFASGETLAETLANDVAGKLEQALRNRGSALIAVSGGSTPGRFFDALARKNLDWKNIVVTLVDERFVPPSSERSNERLVRERLLTSEARLARFAPLYADAGSVEQAAAQAEAGLALFGPSLDVAILGMGTDGHTASFFPDASNLADLVDPAQSRGVMAVHAKSAGEPRLTLPLSRLVEAGFLALHIEGSEKRAVLKAALRPGDAKPISAIFAHAVRPVPVYWAG